MFMFESNNIQNKLKLQSELRSELQIEIEIDKIMINNCSYKIIQKIKRFILSNFKSTVLKEEYDRKPESIQLYVGLLIRDNPSISCNAVNRSCIKYYNTAISSIEINKIRKIIIKQLFIDRKLLVKNKKMEDNIE